jgi:hypothetical protein
MTITVAVNPAMKKGDKPVKLWPSIFEVDPETYAELKALPRAKRCPHGHCILMMHCFLCASAVSA